MCAEPGVSIYGRGQLATRAAVVYQTLRCEVATNCDYLAKTA